MDFSELILHYIQKHYSPLATRIVHILIIFSIAISSAILTIRLSSDSTPIYVVIGYSIVLGILTIYLITNRKNDSVEKMERAIILNSNFLDGFDDEKQKITLEEIDKVFSPKGKIKPDKKMHRRRLNDCLQVLDPDNKSGWKK